jgi:choline dehydrogenase-like flavoprotein
VVDPKYLSTETDRFILRTAIRDAVALTSTEPLASELEEEPPAGWPALTTNSTDEEIDARIRRFCGTISHPHGTASLGKVVDANFKVNGIERLRVVDASVLPEPISAMPQATIYAFAEIAAELVAETANQG